MHQNVRKNGVVIVSNNAQSDTCSLPGKSPTFYITNQFCRVRYIERLLYKKRNRFTIQYENIYVGFELLRNILCALQI
jgi:hypothetical protein